MENSSLCGFLLTYGDGSFAAGWLATDYLAWEGLSFSTDFGAIQLASADLEIPPIDGIVGLGYSALGCSPTCVAPMLEAMASKLSMKWIFQICLTESSGQLVLGHYDETIGKASPIWVPMALNQPPDFYGVKPIGDLLVNGNAAKLPRFQLGVIDSGSTLLILTLSGFAALVNYIRRNFCHIPGLCGKSSWFQSAGCTTNAESTIDQMLAFQLQSFSIVLGTRDYMIKASSTKAIGAVGYWCLGLMAGLLPSEIDIIFRVPVMMKYSIVFDQERSQLGFPESMGTCSLGDLNF